MMRTLLLVGAATLVSSQNISYGQSQAFIDGLHDRTNYETWFAALPKPNQDGAAYWAAQRSLSHPGTCNRVARNLEDIQLEDGCRKAQQTLAPYDVRRKSEPDYKMGWNSYQTPAYHTAEEPMVIPPQATPTGNSSIVTGAANLSIVQQPQVDRTPTSSPKQHHVSVDGIPSQVIAGIKARCATKWSDNYQMQDYCINQQKLGYLSVHKDDDETAETTASNETNVPEKITTPTPTYNPALAAHSTPRITGFSGDDLSAIVDASKHRELQFARDYRGKPFAATGIFAGASENFLIKGTYMFKVKTSGGVVNCHTSDQALLGSAANWNEGQRVIIAGIIEDTLFGDLQLDDTCKVVAQ